MLEESVSVLLHCFEATAAKARKGYSLWEVEGAVKCACSFRRIYEEVQKVALTLHVYPDSIVLVLTCIGASLEAYAVFLF